MASCNNYAQMNLGTTSTMRVHRSDVLSSNPKCNMQIQIGTVRPKNLFKLQNQVSFNAFAHFLLVSTCRLGPYRTVHNYILNMG